MGNVSLFPVLNTYTWKCASQRTLLDAGNIFLPQQDWDPCAMTSELRGKKDGMELVVFLGGPSALSKQDECRE